MGDQLTAMVTDIWGRALAKRGPVPWGRMQPFERQALVSQYSDEIRHDVEALGVVLRQSRVAGIEEAFAHIQRADGLDALAVLEVIESYDPMAEPEGFR